MAGDIIALGNISGSSLNPARTFGPYLIDVLSGGPVLWAKYWIYVAGLIIGSVAAAFVYDYVAELKVSSE